MLINGNIGLNIVSMNELEINRLLALRHLQLSPGPVRWRGEEKKRRRRGIGQEELEREVEEDRFFSDGRWGQIDASHNFGMQLIKSEEVRQ